MQLLADAGVPMIAVYWPPAWLALIPVITIEAYWARRVLAVTWANAFGSTALANLVSTLVGIPLAWFVWAVLELRFAGAAMGLNNPAESIYAMTVQAAWLIPYEDQLWWLIPIAAIVLTVVFFFASVGIEWAIMRSIFHRAKGSAVRRWAWTGNLLSYAVILLAVLIFLYVPRASLDRVSKVPVNFVINAAWKTALCLIRRASG
jgi:hypothetical protein